MPAQFDRMALNAAMDYLARGEKARWLEMAEYVLAFGRALSPMRGNEQYTIGRAGDSSDSPVTGYAQGQGTVDYDARAKRDPTYRTNLEYERVGQYRVTHFPELLFVRFEHFQKSGPFTRVDDPELPGGYAIGYVPDGAPAFFAVIVMQDAKQPSAGARWQRFVETIRIVLSDPKCLLRLLYLHWPVEARYMAPQFQIVHINPAVVFTRKMS